MADDDGSGLPTIGIPSFGGGGDDGGGGGGGSLPSFSDLLKGFTDNFGAAKSLLKDPKTYIVGVIFEVFIGGFLDLLAEAVGLVLGAFGIAAEAPLLLARSALGAFGGVGDAILSMVAGTIGAVTDLVVAAGPAGPILAALTLWALAEVAVRLAPAVIELIPSLGPALNKLLGW
jgi:hypothetical protein